MPRRISRYVICFFRTGREQLPLGQFLSARNIRKRSMAMNQVIALITSLHVLAHCIFGCCAHHGVHGGDVQSCVQAADERCCEHSHHCAPHGPAESAGDEYLTRSFSSPDRSHHDCPHTGCHWLDTKFDCAGNLLKVHLDAMTAAQCPSLHFPTANCVVAFSNDSYARVAAPPLRLHLALGVLVI